MKIAKGAFQILFGVNILSCSNAFTKKTNDNNNEKWNLYENNFFLAIYQGDLNKIKTLIQSGNIGEEAINLAVVKTAIEGRVEMGKILLDQVTDLKSIISAYDIAIKTVDHAKFLFMLLKWLKTSKRFTVEIGFRNPNEKYINDLSKWTEAERQVNFAAQDGNFRRFITLINNYDIRGNVANVVLVRSSIRGDKKMGQMLLDKITDPEAIKFAYGNIIFYSYHTDFLYMLLNWLKTSEKFILEIKHKTNPHLPIIEIRETT